MVSRPPFTTQHTWPFTQFALVVHMFGVVASPGAAASRGVAPSPGAAASFVASVQVPVVDG
jgi:hypothetical protein